MQYYYYQKEGGTEVWKPIPETKLDTIEGSMFRTILSVDVPVSDDATKEQLASIKYKGPLYFDLDDAASPASTAQHAVALVKKLEDHGVFPSMLEIYASGGKGFHILVPEECFLTKPPKQGLPNLPAIFKEMAFQLAVPSMDYRVYTARKGRMFRCHNVLRPNGMYKVRLSVAELETVAEFDKEEAEAHYKTLCSKPRKTLDVPSDEPDLATGLLALFDQCKAKVSKVAAKTKKRKPTKLPENLPSFEAMLKGEGVKGDVGFHPIAMQIAITAHAKGMSREALLEAAEGLCNNHESDGHRYNTPAKRREELGRMWDYTEDNPCYEYSSAAISSLLTHSAPDLKGLDVTDEEVQAGIDNPDEGVVVEDEYEHAGVVMTKRGAFMLTEHGPKQLTAMSFENASELVSTENNQVSVVQADVLIAGNKVGTKVFELDTFNSVSNLNKMTMRYGQSFSGNDVQARGMYMRLVEKARKAKNRMYAVNREGLDVVSISFHEDPDLQQPFMIWADAEGVTPEPKIKEKNVIFKFVGFPDDRGQFQSDLSTSPSLAALIKDEDQKKQMLEFCHNLLECQKPAYLGRLLGWMVSCHYRMLFHKLYAKFPLLHINGSAGQGKTELTRLIATLHYHQQEPKMLTPTSTLFAVQYAAAGSASIPLILDEFKPSEMNIQAYDRFKLMMRDAYNCRSVERGGGTRENSDYRSVHTTQLSAPICFIAEAAESESALMERVVLLTLIKPAGIQLTKYKDRFDAAVSSKHFLSSIGQYLAAGIVRKYSLEMLNEEFSPLLARARKRLMLTGEEENLSAEDLAKRAGAKDRTVFNYAVAEFGLSKFQNLLTSIFGDEFNKVFAEMREGLYDSVEELQAQTLPEWLKVFNCFADMSRSDEMATYYLAEGKDYAFVNYDGRSCIELYARACYFKYRAYCGTARSKPLFPSEAAFVHALSGLTALVAKGAHVDLDCPGGSHVFDLDLLRSAGFLTPGK